MRFAPFLRVACLTLLCWGLVTLMILTPKVHKAEAAQAEEDPKHILLLLDVSPSMRLQDSGPSGEQSRKERGADLLKSFFRRIGVEQYRLSVVAFYTEAKPVVIDTQDMDVVDNILNDLPMHFAFNPGETNLFSGLKEAARMAQPWNPRSATLVIVSDGDTVPATGMPRMPASVANTLVIGVGDPVTGSFINGRQSRQDASTLRQVAIRLGGTYHNGNKKHLSSDFVADLMRSSTAGPFEKLTRREYALMACGLGGFGYALLPLFLAFYGTSWKPGVPLTPSAFGRNRPSSFFTKERASSRQTVSRGSN